jgi:anaerobic ribonucleoside-triphosphate reductase activating protein
MNYADIKKMDLLNGAGIRLSLFVSGCHFHCQGCFNAKAWNSNFGEPYTQETEDQIISDLKNPLIDGLSLLGGEPFDHTYELTKLLKRVRQECLSKNVWGWSGFTLEELLTYPDKVEMLKLIDVLVDGQFMIDEKDLTLQFRGSTNQRIIHVPKSLSQHKPILWHEED